MLKIAVTGCAGRMGREISSAIYSTDGVELAGGTEVSNSYAIGQGVFMLAGAGSGGPAVVDDLSKIIDDIDIVIDFTSPVATMKHFDLLADNGKSIVIGTTGLSPAMKDHMHSRAGDIRCVFAPNMSVGVNVMFRLVAEAVKIIGKEYDMEIIDIHHNKKKDAPSGTAERLAEICAKGAERDLEKVAVYGRHGETGERTKDEIGIMTLRAGDVVGEHTVIFAGPGERVEITHKAGSRMNFANGSVCAAKWLAGKEPGIYDMQDVLDLKIEEA